MRCGHCGKKLRNNAKFCTYCGNTIAENATAAPPQGGSVLVSVLSLLTVVTFLVTGSVWLIMKEMIPARNISASDHVPVVFDTSGTRADDKLVGTWRCTDPAAVGFDPGQPGIAVDVLLIMRADASFHLEYTMRNTGIIAVQYNTDGSYVAQKNHIRFYPATVLHNSEFFKSHGDTPTFSYHTYENIIEMTQDNGKSFVFNREA